MKTYISLLAAALLVLPAIAANVAVSGTAPEQAALKAYPLHGNPNSADISPNEQLVAVAILGVQDAKDPAKKQFLEKVQLWNFKADDLVAEFVAERTSAPATGPGKSSYMDRSQHFVRFSSDGTRVIALIGRTVYILSAQNLIEIRTILLEEPNQAAVGMSPFVARDMEISPNGESIAVLWANRIGRYAVLQIYDLASGTKASVRDAPQQEMDVTDCGMAWAPDGDEVLIAAAHCGSMAPTPDVLAIDSKSLALHQKLTTGLLAGRITVGTDNRMLAVEGHCHGLWDSRNPKLNVVDVATGKLLHEVPGRRGGGVWRQVSESSDGSRFVAFTGITKQKFDWLDLQWFPMIKDESFTVWNSKSYAKIVTSQNIPGLSGSELRMSAKGSYVLSFGVASFVYEVP